MNKATINHEYYEYRGANEDMTGVEDINETLDRCENIYFLTVYQRENEHQYPALDLITIQEIFSEEPIYDFRPVFEEMGTPGFQVVRWEMKGR